MRLPLIPPAKLTPEQRPLYDDMRRGIEQNFKGFRAIAPTGELIGPWNPWLHFPKFGKPVWELVKALATAPSLPKPVREVAILVTGAHFRSAYEFYAHVLVAEARELPDEKIATIAAGQRPSDLTREEAAAYDVAATLVAGGPLAGTDLPAGRRAFRRERYRRVDQSDWPLLRGIGHAQRVRCPGAGRGARLIKLPQRCRIGVPDSARPR